MERGSDKHGFRLDEAMEKETRGMMTSGHDPRGEEWRSAEPSGEDQPDVDLAPNTTLTGGTPEGMTSEDVEGRSELAALLGKEIWPAEGAQVKQRVRDENGPDRVINLVDRLPDGRVYDNVADVWVDLTGHKESHRF
jgi:hypothetical protein